MLKENERAKGTKGQLVGRDISGGYQVEPPEDLPTLADLEDGPRGSYEVLRDETPTLADQLSEHPDIAPAAAVKVLTEYRYLMHGVRRRPAFDSRLQWCMPDG